MADLRGEAEKLVKACEHHARLGRLKELQQELATHPIFSDRASAVRVMLNYAVDRGKADLAEALMKLGGDVNQNEAGQCLLSCAVERSDVGVKMVRLLLEHGADVNVRLLNDDTPLHLASRANKLNAAELLLSYRADVNAVSRIDFYFTPLMEACSRGYFEMIDLLLRHGADPRFQNCLGETCETVAAARSRQRIARMVRRYWEQGSGDRS